MKLRITLLALIVAILPLAGHSAEIVSVQDNYKKLRIQKGDTLSKIAMQYMWQVLHGMNKDVIEDPNLIYPGQVIKIPNGDIFFDGPRNRSYDADQFSVSYAAPDDALFKGDDGSERMLKSGLDIKQFGRIEVKNGPLRLELAKESDAVVYEESTLLFSGVKKRGDQMVRSLELSNGRVFLDIQQELENPVVIATAAGAVQITRGMFEVEMVDPDQLRVSVYSGQATVIRPDAQRIVEQGKGMLVHKAKALPNEVHALPPAVSKDLPAGTVGTTVNFSWQPIQGVAEYELLVSRDPYFNDIMFKGEVFDAAVFEMGIYNLGKYYWKIKAVDSAGFRSIDLRPFPFNVAAKAPRVQ